ncbi:MAG TPA: aldose epimerase family protein [Myxococcota bacterium]|nr:aldose epimerase family protein [Myxococcota bacterium]HQK51956.1 aldose epimerase family protein [Myxococcota bacterium]
MRVQLRSCPWMLALVLMIACATTRPGPGDAPPREGPVTVRSSPFGTLPDGTEIIRYTLRNPHGMTARIITYGATLTELWVPDRDGVLGDVVLGFDDLEGYRTRSPYFGAIVGRVANRIAGGRFRLDGVEYRLATNNGPNFLHGGQRGFDKVVWSARTATGEHDASVRLTYVSPDGEEGFPGTLTVQVVYTLTDDDVLRLDYTATTDRPTPVNLSNHTYWNLRGEGDILGHVLWMDADAYTPVDETLIPTGQIAPVRGTPMDFTTPTPVGARIDQVPGIPVGYDHNFVLRSGGGRLALALRLSEPTTGRLMEMWTTEPGIQFYSGNFLDGTLVGKRGIPYPFHGAIVLEAQHFPDSVNQPGFPSIVLRPGQTYTQTTLYRFTAK